MQLPVISHQIALEIENDTSLAFERQDTGKDGDAPPRFVLYS